MPGRDHPRCRAGLAGQFLARVGLGQSAMGNEVRSFHDRIRDARRVFEVDDRREDNDRNNGEPDPIETLRHG